MDNKKLSALESIKRVAEFRTKNRVRQQYEFRAEKDPEAMLEYEQLMETRKATLKRKAEAKAAAEKAKAEAEKGK